MSCISLENFKKRLKALEEKEACDGIERKRPVEDSFTRTLSR